MIGSVTGTRAVIAAALLALGLAACSGSDPEPNVAPSSSVSPGDESSSEGATDGPAPPPEAAGLTQAGAESFIDYWFRALSYGMVSGNTTRVDTVSARSCKSCQALIQQIKDLYAKGGRLRTTGWSVGAMAVSGEFEPASPSFLLRVDEASRILVDGDKVVDRTPPAEVPMHIGLSSGSGAWIVARLEIIE